MVTKEKLNSRIVPITVVVEPAVAGPIITDGKCGVVLTVEPEDFDRGVSSLRRPRGVQSIADGL